MIKMNFSIEHLVNGFILITILLQSGIECFVLTTSGHVVEVNKSVTFNCSLDHFEAEGVRYYLKNQSGNTIETIHFTNKGGGCLLFGGGSKTFNVSVTCVNSSFSLTMLSVTKDFHNVSLFCGLYNSNGSTNSTPVVIEVAFPVTRTTLVGPDGSDTTTAIEYNKIVFRCITAPSYPASNVTWYRSNGSENGIVIKMDTIRMTEKKEDDYLITTESNITLNVSRTFNDTSIYCTASNGYGEKAYVQSSKLLVLVHYPPSKPKVYIRSHVVEGNINVTKGNELSLNCTSDGYPPPSFFWRIQDKVILTGMLLTVDATNKTHNGTYICKANNTMKKEYIGEHKTEISVTILIPPSRPEFYFNGSNGNTINGGSVSVVKYDNFTIVCRSSGVPTPVYTWSETGTTNESLNVTLVPNDLNRTCQASSTMVETFGKTTTVSKKATLGINVLFPPGTPNIRIQNSSGISKDVYVFVTVEEFTSFNLTCLAFSKPSVENYTWSGQEHSFSNKVIMHNVSRSKDGPYTCRAYNLMQRSFGDKQIGQSYKTVTVHVLYAAEVTDFFVAGQRKGNPVIVNQKENATFLCDVDSNPGSLVRVYFKDKLLVNDTDTRNLSYSVRNLTCSDAGIYECHSSNRINNGIISKKRLTLFVKCPPLPEKDFKIVNVTTLKYVTANLGFKAMDYLDTNTTIFTWQKENNASQWETVTNDTNGVKISTFNLQTNLTVVNVTEYYSGNYRVVYNNSVGGNIQIFQLSVADLPDPPKYFDYLKGSLTSTDVTVFWTKGFSGGLMQTFVLNISKNSQPIDYDYINETENENMQHTITGLSSGTQYQLTLWASNELGNSSLQTITIFTKELVVDSTPNLTAPIAGSVSSLVVIVAGVSVAFLLYRRRTFSAKKSDTGKLVYQNVPFEGKKQKKHLAVNTNTLKKDVRGKPYTQEETSFQVLQEVDDTPPLYNERCEYYNSAEKIAEIEKIKVSELLPYVLGRDEESFEAEYQKLPTGLQHPCTFARKPENIALNRYNGIYPYDHSRVKIEGLPDFFINACYINGYTREREYIASLGPTKKVTYEYQSFWLMVWNEHSDIIVMLTNLHEPSGMKCEQYWPECGTTKCYGDIQVSSDREEVFAEYTVRNFIVLNAGEKRSVTHLHYTAWPDKKVPEDVTTLIEFRERLRATASTGKGPVIVHCSAGIGRTGTLIALDRLIKEGQCESSVDVFKCVNSMREQRVKMVQTLEQYIYIYKALVNSLYFDSEMIPIESFREYVDTTNNNIYSRQFQQLKETVEDCIKDKSDTHAESEMLVDKNRRGADIPGRQFRVLVYLNRNTNDSDYINAVYVNSLRRKDHFILAQTPLPNTVTDFVCMMYQENCCCVVTMEDLKEPGMKVGHYLPTDGHSLKFGDITISCTVLETKPQYTVREIRLQNNRQTENREKVAYHFHYTKWMQGNDTPTDAKEFVQFIKDVEDYADQLGEEQSHVLVHCLKANERSALYCIVTILTEKMRHERQVSVLNTVRHLRTRRRTAITSMEQLKFCYQALNAYISLYEQ